MLVGIWTKNQNPIKKILVQQQNINHIITILSDWKQFANKEADTIDIIFIDDFVTLTSYFSFYRRPQLNGRSAGLILYLFD